MNKRELKIAVKSQPHQSSGDITLKRPKNVEAMIPAHTTTVKGKEPPSEGLSMTIISGKSTTNSLKFY